MWQWAESHTLGSCLEAAQNFLGYELLWSPFKTKIMSQAVVAHTLILVLEKQRQVDL